nr:unnamed protein product [Digitaria exilis]
MAGAVQSRGRAGAHHHDHGEASAAFPPARAHSLGSCTIPVGRSGQSGWIFLHAALFPADRLV